MRPKYCRRYRPAARMPKAVDCGTSHLGFRGIVRRRPDGASRLRPNPVQKGWPAVSTSPPPWLIGLLVAVAAATLAVGVGLEGTSWVDRYPFQVNVLSEIAGLAVATLATLLFLNKAVEDWKARRWRSAKESAVVSAVYDARHLAGWLAELHGVGDAPDELEPMGQIGFDRLVAELRETRNRLQGVRSAARFFRDPWLAGHPGHHGRSSANRPFSASHTTNPLNHAEALWDPTLQAQVVSILSRLRAPTVSGQAVTRITPYPVRQFPAPHTVTASDAITGAPHHHRLGDRPRHLRRGRPPGSARHRIHLRLPRPADHHHRPRRQKGRGDRVPDRGG